MIRVTLYRKNGCLTGFDCVGHAGFDEYGKDIVCAAVSVLTTTCVNALESVAKAQPRVSVKEGNMKVRLADENSRDAQVILLSMCQGLKDIQTAYPDHLQLMEN